MVEAVLAAALVLAVGCSALAPPVETPAVEGGPAPVEVASDQPSDGAMPSATPAAPQTGHWRPATAPPLGPRVDPAVVWNGDEVIVVGGADPACRTVGPCDLPRLTDGAAYDPASDTWREMVDLPAGVDVQVSAAAPDGIVIGRPDQTPWRYDADEDDWSRLPAAPDGLDRLAVAGGRMVAYAHSQLVIGPRDHLFDPFRRQWQPVPADPLGPTEDRQMVWLGESLVLTGTAIDPEAFGVVRAARLDDALDEDAGWTELPDGLVATGTGWVATEAGLMRPAPGSAVPVAAPASLPSGAVLQPDPAAWYGLPQLADAGPEAADAPAALDVPAAAEGRTVVAGVHALDLQVGTWATISHDPLVPRDPVAIWAGDRVVVWGGSGPAATAATWQPPWADDVGDPSPGADDPTEDAVDQLDLAALAALSDVTDTLPGPRGRPDARIDCGDAARTRLTDTYPGWSDGDATPQQALHEYLARQADHDSGRVVIVARIHASVLAGDREVVSATARQLPEGGWVPALLTACGDVDLVIA